MELMGDISHMKFPKEYFNLMEPRMQKAFRDLDTIESGEIANLDDSL